MSVSERVRFDVPRLLVYKSRRFSQMVSQSAEKEEFQNFNRYNKGSLKDEEIFSYSLIDN